MGTVTGKISAVLLAAGRGTRLKDSTPKVYLPLGKSPIFHHSLERFAECTAIFEIVVVIHPDDTMVFQKTVPHLVKPIQVVYGGAQRQDSALAGVRAAVGDYVLVHDAARPLVSKELIERVIEAMKTHRAAVPVVPIADSVKRVWEDQIISDIERSELFCAQTPQGFERALLLKSLERACAENRYFTDESGAVLAMAGVRAKAVPGEETNIKITTAADLKVAECLLSQI